jgi:zinc transport system substrate-binding protein
MRARAAIAALVVAGAVAGCAGEGEPSSADSMRVVTSVYPLTYVAERVGGQRAAVTALTPAGAEPHDLELSPSQVRAISDADLVVYVGGGFQPAVEDGVADLDGSRKLDVLSGLSETEARDAGDDVDPHVWLSPRLFADVASRVADRLVEVDPDGADVYRANRRRLVSDLEALHQAFKRGLRRCRRRAIVVSHEAFGYLSDEYGLRQVGISGSDPENEPSPARLAEVKEFAEARGITTVFLEELASASAGETLAAELGGTTDVLSPLESPPPNGDYLTAMRTNLESLREALDCR